MLHFALLTGVQAFLTVVFYIGALVFVVTRRSRLSPRSARLATWGVGLLLAGWVVSAVWPLAFSGYSATVGAGPDFVTFAALMSFMTGVAHIAAVVLLLMALFGNNSTPAAWPAPPAGPAVMPPTPPVMPPSAPGSQAAPGGIPPWPGMDQG